MSWEYYTYSWKDKILNTQFIDIVTKSLNWLMQLSQKEKVGDLSVRA